MFFCYYFLFFFLLFKNTKPKFVILKNRKPTIIMPTTITNAWVNNDIIYIPEISGRKIYFENLVKLTVCTKQVLRLVLTVLTMICVFWRAMSIINVSATLIAQCPMTLEDAIGIYIDQVNNSNLKIDISSLIDLILSFLQAKFCTIN